MATDFPLSFANEDPGVDQGKTLTKDPVMNQLDVVQKELDTLRDLLSPTEAIEDPGEMAEPQTDEEVVAGIPPTPKKPDAKPFAGL